MAAVLAKRRNLSRLRRRLTLSSAQSTQVEVDGKRYLNFSSNDYLGLANHAYVVAAFQKAAAQYGVGSGSSHLVCGHSAEHHALEEELADFTGRDKALLFTSGYMANLGVISALLNRKDFLLQDKLNHASLLDAAQLSQADWKRFPHNDLSKAEQFLVGSNGIKKCIAVDGVFSMDGAIAPLAELASLAEQHQAYLLVDDAHGFGVLGQKGAGSLEYFSLSQQQVPILMGTLGKSLGAAGAFVAGSADFIEFLIQTARTYIYTTALPPAVAAAARASLRTLQAEPHRRESLHNNIRYFRSSCAANGLNLMPSDTAIQPLVLGTDQVVLHAADYMRLKGFWIGAIRPPTVPEGTARLRITLCAEHTHADIDTLVACLMEWMTVYERS